MAKQLNIFGGSAIERPDFADKAETRGGSQQALFAKKGLPGQRVLFDDGVTPDDMVARPTDEEVDPSGGCEEGPDWEPTQEMIEEAERAADAAAGDLAEDAWREAEADAWHSQWD